MLLEFHVKIIEACGGGNISQQTVPLTHAHVQSNWGWEAGEAMTVTSGDACKYYECHAY